jgi:hypothetical protein
VKAFTDADITLEPIPWLEDVDDARARADWDWSPENCVLSLICIILAILYFLSHTGLGLTY